MTATEFATRPPAHPLCAHATRYYGFREATTGPLRRREGPGKDIVIVVSFEDEWLIDGFQDATRAAA